MERYESCWEKCETLVYLLALKELTTDMRKNEIFLQNLNIRILVNNFIEPKI